MLEQRLPPGPGIDRTPWAGRRLPNPWIDGQRMHDRVDRLRPGILELPEGGVAVVRPDRVVVGRYSSAAAIPQRIRELIPDSV